MKVMQPLEEQILGYVYILKRKYEVDSVSLSRLCYKMQRHTRVVKPVVDILLARGLLKPHYEGDKNGFAISEEGIEYIEYKGIVKIRNWVVEE